MLDVALFRNPRFTAASVSVAISFFALSGFIFLDHPVFPVREGLHSPRHRGAASAGGRLCGGYVGRWHEARRTDRQQGGRRDRAPALFAAGLLWTSTASGSTSYLVIVGQMLFLGSGMGLTSAPATEAIMGAVPAAKAGVGSAVNDATRLFGGTLGVAVIGSVATSLYATRLGATFPPGSLPAHAVSSAKGSVGGAIIASTRSLEARFRPGGAGARPLRHECVSVQPGWWMSLRGWCRHRRGCRRHSHFFPLGPAQDSEVARPDHVLGLPPTSWPRRKPCADRESLEVDKYNAVIACQR